MVARVILSEGTRPGPVGQYSEQQVRDWALAYGFSLSDELTTEGECVYIEILKEPQNLHYRVSEDGDWASVWEGDVEIGAKYYDYKAGAGRDDEYCIEPYI